MVRRSSVWVTWERQRRSIEMAEALGAQIYIFQSRLPWALRAVALSGRTIAVLIRDRPKIVFVQNPSMVLAAVACLSRPFLGFKVIVDRHSNFRFHKMKDKSIKYRCFHALSRWTVRQADLTIVTNGYLKSVVEEWGGRGYVLQDKIPNLNQAVRRDLGKGRHVVCVSSFGQDEPTDAVIQAATLLEEEVTIYVTGNEKKCAKSLRASAPSNVVFTGFMSEADYQSLLSSADAVMVLTRQDYTLVCGAYEAIGLGRPLILSSTRALIEYFGKSAVFTENDPASIAKSIGGALNARDELCRNSALAKEELEATWKVRFQALVRKLNC